MDAPPFDLDEYCGGLRGNKDEMDVTVRAFHVPGLASKSASARRACVQQIFVVVTSRRWVQLRAVNAETSGPASKYWASAGARLVARDFRLDPMESCMFHDAVNVARAALQGRTIERHDPVDEMKFMARVMVDVERKMADKGIEAVAWTDMLHDPFFSFLGSKRKLLPPTAERLGVDAGLEKDEKNQRNHYFAALWKLPRPAARDNAVGYTLLPEQGRLEASLYLGPKQDEPLLAFEKPFTQVIDYGFFGAVAHLLFWILKKIHALVGNWGWSIVLFTLVIRLTTWHLNTKQTISMLRMKDFEPHQKAIQAKYEKFGSDMTKKAEMQKELMELYKKNGHNPMGGCLPMLLQMPIFLALWSMLNAVFELRNAPFFGWIVDLSSRDPYFIYPVLMGGSMFAQQYMTPAVGDPAQRKMMLVLMPAMMTFMFAQSPAGLTIYYFVFNMIGLGQTWWIMRSYQPQSITL